MVCRCAGESLGMLLMLAGNVVLRGFLPLVYIRLGNVLQNGLLRPNIVDLYFEMDAFIVRIGVWETGRCLERRNGFEYIVGNILDLLRIVMLGGVRMFGLVFFWCIVLLCIYTACRRRKILVWFGSGKVVIRMVWLVCLL